MRRSESLADILPALLKAQQKMGRAVKDAKNPFYKSNYADMNSVLDATLDILNDEGILVLQPHRIDLVPNAAGVHQEYLVETVLFHVDSGDFVSGESRVVVAKENDCHQFAAGLTYARRLGLQSLLALGAEDDDGNSAMSGGPTNKFKKSPPKKAGPYPTKKDEPKKATVKKDAAPEKSSFRKPKPVESSEDKDVFS